MSKVDMPWLGTSANTPQPQPSNFEIPNITGDVGSHKPTPAPLPFNIPSIGGTTGNERTPSRNTST